LSGGAVELGGYPGETVTLRCDRCSHERTWPKAELVARYGARANLPQVLGWLTARCPHRADLGVQACMAVYAELARCVPSLPPA